MGTNYNKQTLGSGYSSTTQMQDAEDETSVSFTDTLSRTGSGTGSNAMASDLDLNSNKLLNVPNGVSNSDGVNYGQMLGIAGVGVGNTSSVNQQATATQGQTIFTTPTYTVGLNNLHVYVNGQKQYITTSYSETTITSITFLVGLNLDDVVEFTVNQVGTTLSTVLAGNVQYNGSTVQAALESQERYFDTVSSVTAYTGFVVGDVVIIEERGSALFDVVLTSGVTPNTFEVIISVAVATLSFVLRVSGNASIKAFGGVDGGESTGAINAAILYAKNNNKTTIVDGVYHHSGQLVFQTLMSMKGSNVDSTGFLYTGAAGTFGTAFSGAVGQRCSFKDFYFRGDTSDELLVDFTGLRYSAVENVQFAACKTACRLNLTWGNVFTTCYFKCGDDTGVPPVNSIGIEIVAGGAFNATHFSGCTISANVKGMSITGGRNIVINDACTFELNTVAIELSGSGQSFGIKIESNYFENNSLDTIFVERGAGARDDRLLIRNNYISTISGQRTGLLNVNGTPAGGESYYVVEDNIVEQLLDNSNPVTTLFTFHTLVQISTLHISRISNH